MYLFKTKHRVLTIINDEIVKSRNPDKQTSSRFIINKINGYNKQIRVLRALSSLNANNHIGYVSATDETYPIVYLTKPGLDALSRMDYLKKQNSLIWGIVRDFLLVTTAIAVAIGTFYAVVKSTDTQNVKEDMQKIKELQRKQEIELTHQASQLQILKDSIASFSK